ncbi:hypothetical protein LCGC14_2472560, partial [marine sediment metagenome]
AHRADERPARSPRASAWQAMLYGHGCRFAGKVWVGKAEPGFTGGVMLDKAVDQCFPGEGRRAIAIHSPVSGERTTGGRSLSLAPDNRTHCHGVGHAPWQIGYTTGLESFSRAPRATWAGPPHSRPLRARASRRRSRSNPRGSWWDRSRSAYDACPTPKSCPPPNRSNIRRLPWKNRWRSRVEAKAGWRMR